MVKTFPVAPGRTTYALMLAYESDSERPLLCIFREKVMLNRSDIWRSRDSLCLQRYEDSLSCTGQSMRGFCSTVQMANVLRNF